MNATDIEYVHIYREGKSIQIHILSKYVEKTDSE